MPATTPRPSLNILRLLRRRPPDDPEPPEGMRHVRETRAMADARRRYEEQAREEFDERVARASGTFGWETFSLFILTGGALACALLGTMRGAIWWAYPLGGVGALCLIMLLLRGLWSRRRRGRSRMRAPRD
ncbi:hypothetical protein [Streptomyces sp. NPDC001843]|uniref:hypothetical protein n=1 Tax=Streptomyces sp. NPDC001843 TaxID=3364617 RepID=UPI00368FDEDB